MNIRTLKANEIECRVQTVKDNGCSILLYKDARCDMKILDEVFGALGWEREHQLINGKLFCTVRVWDNEKQRWISKQDVGTESNTEATKGEASDSFKRACFNVGIGRELYSAPFIWVKLASKDEAKRKKFYVRHIGYDNNREINSLILVDEKGKEVYKMGNVGSNIECEKYKCESCGTDAEKAMAERTYRAYGKHLCKACGVKEAEARKQG